jgi:3-oxoadipate enol-lactonase
VPFIDCGGRAVYAEFHGALADEQRAGEGAAPIPVLLLHGAGSNAATWWQQLPSFTTRHPVVTMDMRCFGRSAAPLEEFDHRYFVTDALTVLDYFCIQRAAIVGQSLGGMVGLRLALQHPERVAAFVSCDSPLGVQQPDILAALEARVRRASSQTLEQRSLGAWFLQRSPERAALYAQINHFNPGSHSLPVAEWRQAMDRLVAAENLLPMTALREIGCPVLWLVGREDPLVPLAAMQEAHGLTAGSELAVVDDCGHSTYFEKPEVFNHLVMDFLARRLD